ncbi:unnamed protein product [Hydatigera taeniaeformis]|uniref:BZIP domain-containing protein n=1 Tax=Hydatigena taeniaeformis TaxID=6205 RepID=A0A0R3X9V8_HYDTA|nr:unnamed protein product [Hydatigera taeniaeformis]
MEKETPRKRTQRCFSPSLLTEPTPQPADISEPWMPNLSQSLQAPDLMAPFMLPTPYWPFGGLSKLDQMTSAAATAMRQLVTQQISDRKTTEQSDSRARSSTTGFSASQLAAPTFDTQNRLPSIPPPGPPISSTSLTAALSAWYGQQTSHSPAGMSQFPPDSSIGDHCASPQLHPPPPPPPPPPPSQHTVPPHNPNLFRSMLSAAMSQQQKESGDLANNFTMEGANASSTGSSSATSSSSTSSSLAAMMAAAAVAMAGLCRNQTVPPFPGMADTEPSAFQIPESQSNGENTGLNLSTAGEESFAEEHTSASASAAVMDDIDDEDIFLRHIEKGGLPRRRKLHRKRDAEIRGLGNKSETYESRLQHHSLHHHQQQQQQQQQKSSRKCYSKTNWLFIVIVCELFNMFFAPSQLSFLAKQVDLTGE